MSALSCDGFSEAQSAIRSHGRPLDIALFEYYFDDGSADSVLLELTRFQNDDGGFGNAIEPDFRGKASSPLATSIGFQYVEEIDLSAEQPLVRDAIDYLTGTYQPQEGYWPPTFKDVNTAPHAIWWHVDEVAPPTEAEWPNPNAELLGYLWKYQELVPEDFLQTVTMRAERNLSAREIVGDESGRRYAILCWERALPHLPVPVAREVRSALETTLRTMDLEEDLHEMYGFAFAFSSESTVAQMYPQTVDRLLESDMEKQAEDGGWWPDWEWGQYEDVWPEVEREWVGKLTLDCLRTLDRFDKLAS